MDAPKNGSQASFLIRCALVEWAEREPWVLVLAAPGTAHFTRRRLCWTRVITCVSFVVALGHLRKKKNRFSPTDRLLSTCRPSSRFITVRFFLLQILTVLYTVLLSSSWPAAGMSWIGETYTQGSQRLKERGEKIRAECLSKQSVVSTVLSRADQTRIRMLSIFF